MNKTLVKRFKVLASATPTDLSLPMDALPSKIELIAVNWLGGVTDGDVIQAEMLGVDSVSTDPSESNRPDKTFVFISTANTLLAGAAGAITRGTVSDAWNFKLVEKDYPLFYSISTITAGTNAVITLTSDFTVTPTDIIVNDLLKVTGSIVVGTTDSRTPYDTEYRVTAINGNAITTSTNSTSFGVYAGPSGVTDVFRRPDSQGVDRAYDRVAGLKTPGSKYILLLDEDLFSANVEYRLYVYANERS